MLDDGFGRTQNDRYVIDEVGGGRVVVRVIRTRAPSFSAASATKVL